MRSVRVKICGITRMEDLETACSLGADAVGFVVGVPKSPRNLSINEAKRLIDKVPIFVKSVLVTVLEDPDEVTVLYLKLGPDIIQVHGGTLETILVLRRKLPEVHLVGAVSIGSEAEIQNALELVPFLDAVLTDSYTAGMFGGTGLSHDWLISRRLREIIYPKPLILAGGLNPENVKEAVKIVKPYAVDVSSGVEARPRLKDHEKIRAFIEGAKSVLIQDDGEKLE